MNPNFMGMLGLARRANKVILGFDQVSVQVPKCKLLVAACDASDRTKRNIDRLGLRVIQTDMKKVDMGKALGVGSCAVLAVTDDGFADALISRLQTESKN